jgi:hypothetical protein
MKCRVFNLAAGFACLVCAIVYTVGKGPLAPIASVVLLGVVNLIFIFI